MAEGVGKEKKRRYRFLNSEGAAALPKFQYNGTDNSLIYKYILSPLAGFFVDNATPTWLAPNAITLTGLMFMVASYCIFYYYCPSIDSCSVEHGGIPPPSWIFVFNAAAMVIYQTLDNMDGKQARKTGSASPLGLLFDHGIDAANSIFGSVNWIIAMGLSTQDHLFHIWVMVLFPMLVFYTSTFEEFFTGKLVLPIINGPNEGLLMGASLSLLSGLLGQEYWHGTDVFDKIASFLPLSNFFSIPVKNYDIIVCFTLISLTKEVTEKLVFVTSGYGLKSLKNFLPISALMVFTFQTVHNDNGVFVRNQRTCFHLCACIFVDMTTNLMLDHMTKQKYNPARLCLAPLVLLHPLSKIATEVQVDRFILASSIAIFCHVSRNVIAVIDDICNILGIWCFDIITPHPEKKKI